MRCFYLVCGRVCALHIPPPPPPGSSQTAFDNTCSVAVPSRTLNTRTAIGRVRITGPHHAPFVVVEGWRIPVRWEVVQRPLGFDAMLVERGNPSARAQRMKPSSRRVPVPPCPRPVSVHLRVWCAWVMHSGMGVGCAQRMLPSLPLSLMAHQPPPPPTHTHTMPPSPPLPFPAPIPVSGVMFAGEIYGACERACASVRGLESRLLTAFPPPLLNLSSFVQRSAILRGASCWPHNPACVVPALQCTLFAWLQWGSSGAVVVGGERPIRNRHPVGTALWPGDGEHIERQQGCGRVAAAPRE
jgi:hypothetical protein